MATENLKQVFLSHSSKDKAFVRRLAEDLRSAGVPVWYDEWELKVGDSLHDRIQQGIQESGYLAVVVSKHSIRSAWVSKELSAGFAKELEAREVVVLPLIVSEVELPLLLKDKLYADFRDDYDKGLSTLLKRLDPDSSVLTRATRRKRVLWIDDDAAFLSPYIHALAERGFRVDTAQTLVDAGESLEAGRYDVVVMDMMMPTASAREENLYPPTDTDLGRSAGIAFYYKYRKVFDAQDTAPLFLTVRLDENARRLVEEAGVSTTHFATKMELRKVEDLVDKVTSLASGAPTYDTEHTWREKQVDRAHELLSSDDRGVVIAGAQIIEAIGSQESLLLLRASRQKWTEDDRVREYFDLVVSKIESGEPR
jgi:CheY-like chemotaxis protein